MTRTQIAALQAAAGAFVIVAGTGAFLGFGLGGSILAGLVLGALGGGLLLAAGARAGTAHDDPTPDLTTHDPVDRDLTEDDDRG